jgi:molybdenum cofactor sulfurtransferase
VLPGSKMRVANQWEAFLSAWPEYTATGALHEIRAREFARLDAAGHVYLDYTGAGLYGESQVRRHMALLLDNVLGNPHSSNPTSQISTELVEAARRHVLAFFNASPDDYCVIFTASASHALKLVGESYPFEPGSRFLLTGRGSPAGRLRSPRWEPTGITWRRAPAASKTGR